MIEESLLYDILSQPSAPFRESRVVSVLTQFFEKYKVPHFLDPAGNVVAGAKDRKDYAAKVKRAKKEPVLVCVAHMDHPGFHLESVPASGEITAKWFGGGPTHHIEGASVWLATEAEGFIGEAKVSRVEMKNSRIQKIFLPPKEFSSKAKPKAIFGGFAFRAPWWTEGDFIYTKAADDLVGTFVVAAVAKQVFTKGSSFAKSHFLGVFTRGEEVGFIGAMAHFKLGWLKNASALVVSLETSRTLPGAEFGKGPVVRLGDRATVFSPGPVQMVSEIASKVLKEEHQRRIMDGGTCEATAAQVFGIPAIGFSIPLGNYHNQSFQGGPDSAGENGPAPEFVHLKDIERLQKLILALFDKKLPWGDPWTGKRKALIKNFGDFEKYL